MRILLILTILLTLVDFKVAFGGNITPIKSGETASYDGFLVSKEQMVVFRTINEKKKLLERKNILLEDLQITHKDMIMHHRNRADSLNKQLRWQETKSTFSNMGYFFLGVFITGAASYATIRTLK